MLSAEGGGAATGIDRLHAPVVGAGRQAVQLPAAFAGGHKLTAADVAAEAIEQGLSVAIHRHREDVVAARGAADPQVVGEATCWRVVVAGQTPAERQALAAAAGAEGGGCRRRQIGVGGDVLEREGGAGSVEEHQIEIAIGVGVLGFEAIKTSQLVGGLVDVIAEGGQAGLLLVQQAHRSIGQAHGQIELAVLVGIEPGGGHEVGGVGREEG